MITIPLLPLHLIVTRAIGSQEGGVWFADSKGITLKLVSTQNPKNASRYQASLWLLRVSARRRSDTEMCIIAVADTRGVRGVPWTPLLSQLAVQRFVTHEHQASGKIAETFYIMVAGRSSWYSYICACLAALGKLNSRLWHDRNLEWGFPRSVQSA